MGDEKPPEFYDNRMDRVGLPYEESPWRDIYDTVVEFLPVGIRIIDVGCGTGRLAEALRRTGHTNYIGFDFSRSRIDEARRYVPAFTFYVQNAFEADLRGADAYVLTEFLEHIEQDRDIISKIPSGALIVFSVPNFDSAGHVRKFENLGAVYSRYSDLLDFTGQPSRTLPKKTRPDKLTFVLAARRR